MFLLVLIHATLAWAPFSKVPCAVTTPVSANPFSSRGFGKYGLSMRFGFTEEGVEAAPRSKQGPMRLPWMNKNLVLEEPSTPSILVPKQSISLPWMNEKSKKILVSPTEVAHEDERGEVGNPDLTVIMIIATTGIALTLAAITAANVFDIRYIYFGQ